MGEIKKIAIHAGHAPANSKACGAVGFLNESTIAREVCQIVAEKLAHMGYEVKDCTCNSFNYSQSSILKNIVDKTNAFNPDISISIHANAANGLARGVECFAYNDKTATNCICANICNNIASLGYRNRGVKYNKDLYVLRKIFAPSLLVEMFFCDNKDDCALYDSELIANAIIHGITGKKADEYETASSLYRVQVGAFKSYENAQRLKAKLETEGYQAFVTE